MFVLSISHKMMFRMNVWDAHKMIFILIFRLYCSCFLKKSFLKTSLSISDNVLVLGASFLWKRLVLICVMTLVNEIVVSTTTIDGEDFQTSPEEGPFEKKSSQEVSSWLKFWLVFFSSFVLLGCHSSEFDWSVKAPKASILFRLCWRLGELLTFVKFET